MGDSARKFGRRPSCDIAAIRRKIRRASSSCEIASSDSRSWSQGPSIAVQRRRRPVGYGPVQGCAIRDPVARFRRWDSSMPLRPCESATKVIYRGTRRYVCSDTTDERARSARAGRGSGDRRALRGAVRRARSARRRNRKVSTRRPELYSARGRGMQEMLIYGVSFDLVGKQPIVLLKTADGNKFLPIWIGHPEAAAILMKLQSQAPPRPMTHDLAERHARAARRADHPHHGDRAAREHVLRADHRAAGRAARSRSTRARPTRSRSRSARRRRSSPPTA